MRIYLLSWKIYIRGIPNKVRLSGNISWSRNLGTLVWRGIQNCRNCIYLPSDDMTGEYWVINVPSPFKSEIEKFQIFSLGLGKSSKWLKKNVRFCLRSHSSGLKTLSLGNLPMEALSLPHMETVPDTNKPLCFGPPSTLQDHPDLPDLTSLMSFILVLSSSWSLFHLKVSKFSYELRVQSSRMFKWPQGWYILDSKTGRLGPINVLCKET